LAEEEFYEPFCTGHHMMGKVEIASASQDLVTLLAKYLIQLQVEDRLESIRTLAKNYDTSVGSISNALNTLEENGAVVIDRRGRMGSFIKRKSLGALWTIGETCPLVIGLTPTTNIRYEGLATGIIQLLRDCGIEAYMIFIRGSRTRLQALKQDRCHAIITSAFAAEEICTKGEQVLIELPVKSFVGGHYLFYRNRSDQDQQPYRVAIDHESTDQARITEMEFSGSNVEYIQVNYTQIHRLLRDGTVDAAVWTDDDMEPYVDDVIHRRPLSEHVLDALGHKDTIASILVRTNQKTVHSVLREAIAPAKVVEIQSKVIGGEILPEY
jgi:hypothetical protein